MDQRLRHRLTYTNLLQGWCDQLKAERLAQVILTERPKLVVEVGVYGGRSLAAMAMAAQALFDQDGHVCRLVGIDPWSRDAALEGGAGDVEGAKAHQDWWSRIDLEKIYQGCQKQLIQLGLENIELWRQRDIDAVGRFRDGEIDCIHLDGNHSRETSLRAVTQWLPKVRVGGLVAMDDLDWVTQAEAIALLKSQTTDYVEYREGQCQWASARKV